MRRRRAWQHWWAIAFGLITTLTTLQDVRAGGDPGYPTDAFAYAWGFLR